MFINIKRVCVGVFFTFGCLLVSIVYSVDLEVDVRVLHRDQESHTDQVGVVFPSFVNGEISYDSISSFVLKQSVSSNFIAWRETKTSGGASFVKGLGSGVAYWVPRPMKEQSHLNAVELARLNGFQASVWGTVIKYKVKGFFDGYILQPYFTYAGSYNDYRSNKLEFWEGVFEGVEIKVGIPSESISLPPYYIGEKTYTYFKSIEDLCFRNTSTGACLYLNGYKATRLRSVDSNEGLIKLTFYGARDIVFEVRLPKEFFAPAIAVDYISMFVAYCRGDWEGAINHATSILESQDLSLEIKRDALLYRGASLFRSGVNGIHDITKAKELSPLSPVVAKYLVLANLHLVNSGVISKKDFLEVKENEEKYYD